MEGFKFIKKRPEKGSEEISWQEAHEEFLNEWEKLGELVEQGEAFEEEGEDPPTLTIRDKNGKIIFFCEWTPVKTSGN